MYSFARGRSNWVARPTALMPSISVLFMKTHALFRLPALSILLTPALLHAAEAAPATTWHAQTLGQALAYMLLFAGVGIVAAIGGYKIFDKCTPGHLNQEILEHRNVVVLFAGVGIVAAIGGYKIFDKCTPGHLNQEILEHRNVAAAIIAAAVILGVCIIIAAAMLG